MILRRLLLTMSRDYPCRRFVEDVTEYLEGTMAQRDRTRLEDHLARCAGCEIYLAQMRTTIELTGQLTTDDVDALGTDARATLFHAFREFHHQH